MCMFAHPAWEHGHVELGHARSSALGAGRAGLPPGATYRGALGEAPGARARSLLRKELTGGGGPDPGLPVSMLQEVPPTLQPPARGSQLVQADPSSPEARCGRGGCGSTALSAGGESRSGDAEISAWSAWLLSRSRAQSAPGVGFV